MSHLVLYRNFRPKNFDEVIGQEHIVRTLKNQVMNQRFGHAYLFCGTRGTGKTSCAKIFARAVNCLSPINGSPCGKCEACLSNLNGGNLDIVEIDAASNNRVDEIRDLRDKIGYLPSVNKYKVYIVDEVHMLTDSAFNALLKTLEEPPQHAMFILATTEPQKLPATILSRCMRFDFKLLSEEDLIAHLKNVFNKSGIKYDEASLKLIAKNGKGSVRDTLSVAEMCSAYCNNDITYEKCQECLGVTDTETIVKILSAIFKQDAKALLYEFNKLQTEKKDFSSLISDIEENINALLTIKVMDGANELLKLPASVYSALSELTSSVSASRLVEMLKQLGQAENQLKLSSNTDMLIQTTLLDLIYSQSEIDKINQRIDALEKKTLDSSVKTVLPSSKTKEVKSVSQSVETPSVSPKVEEKADIVEKQNVLIPETLGQSGATISDLEAKKTFGELAQTLRKQGQMMLYAMLGDVSVSQKGNSILLKCSQVTSKALNEHKKALTDILKTISPMELEIVEISSHDEQKTEDFLKEKFGDKLQIV